MNQWSEIIILRRSLKFAATGCVRYEEVEDQFVAKLVTISKDKKDKKKKKKAPEGGVSL